MDSGDEAEFAILEGDGDDEDYAHGDDSSISEYEPGAPGTSMQHSSLIP